MNAFEEIVKQYLEAEGYWVRPSVKVEISKDDKKAIGLPTMPRPEIDLVALNVRGNELLLVEVKSLLDSYGVWFESVSGEDPNPKYRKWFRLFNDNRFREIVTKRLREEYLNQGLINENTKINYALAAGKIHSSADESKIREYFSKQEEGWILFSPKDIKDKGRGIKGEGFTDVKR
jgi:hypothetical protein